VNLPRSFAISGRSFANLPRSFATSGKSSDISGGSFAKRPGFSVRRPVPFGR
jgi:hypothetical protein